MSTNLSRRQLFKIKLGDLRTLVEEKDDARQIPLFRPPGALEEAMFLQTCERCHACADACPYDVIQICGPASGSLEGPPQLTPGSEPCRWCPTMPCIDACPSGALSVGKSSAVAPIGKVHLNLDQCLTTEGILCDTCSVFCPDEINAIQMVKRSPVLDRDRCVGCGMCVFYCDSDKQPLTLEPFSSR